MKIARLLRVLAFSILLMLPWGIAAGALGEEPRLSWTTGLPTDKPYRPVLVIVSNAPEARKVINFADADVIYEALLQGPGFTRYMAIYNDVHPKEVGSVRSARPYHALVRDEWDCPIAFGTSMGHEGYNIYDYFKEIRISTSFIHEKTGRYKDSALMRSSEIASPHNLFVRMQDLVADFWPADPDNPEMPYEPKAPGLLFSQTPTRGEDPGTQVDIYYDKLNYFGSYQYDAESGTYSRSYAGYPMVNHKTREPVLVTNIIIQWVELVYIENKLTRPSLDLIGSGPAEFYINGTRIHGFWKRSSAQEPTEYYTSLEEDGEPILLKPGKTFIQVFPLAGAVYEDAYDAGHITYTLVDLD